MKMKAFSLLLLVLALVKLLIPDMSPVGTGDAVRSASVLGYIISGEDAPMRVWESGSVGGDPGPVSRRDVEGFELEAMVAETLRSLPLEGLWQ